jgi:hypothetical protein
MYIIILTNLFIYQNLITLDDITHFSNQTIQMMCYLCLSHYAPWYKFFGIKIFGLWQFEAPQKIKFP